LPISIRAREWLGLAGAIAIGPLAVTFGYSQGMLFGVAFFYFMLVFAALVPLLTYAGGRLKILVWQLAVLDLTFSVVGDDVRVHMLFRAREIISAVYIVWALGTLVSAPLPIFFILRPLPGRRRYVVGSLIVVIAVALLLGAKFVAR
jgi:hypothetical protein